MIGSGWWIDCMKPIAVAKLVGFARAQPTRNRLVMIRIKETLHQAGDLMGGSGGCFQLAGQGHRHGGKHQHHESPQRCR